MKLHKMLAQATPFAHLLGLPKAARAEDDEDEDKKQRPDESDDDYAKRMEDEKDEKKSKAEDDSDTESDKDDEDEGGKKSKRAEDGEDDESMRAGRMAERKRCKAIFASEAAGARPDLAAHLAFETNMSGPEAIALLTAAAAGGGRPQSLAGRMSGVKVANVGTDAAEKPNASDPKVIAQQIVAAAKKARGQV